MADQDSLTFPTWPVRLRLHPSPDYVSDIIRRTGDFYEAEMLDYLLRTFLRRGTIVDVGAMIGNHTTYFATYLPHADVVAYEPLRANLKLLHANVDELGVIVHEVALGRSSRRARVAVPDPSNLGHAMLEVGDEVDVRTLDSYELDDVSLIKIDVEGDEGDVLAGAQTTIERSRPWLLVEDWAGPHPPGGYRLLRDWGERHQTYLYVPG